MAIQLGSAYGQIIIDASGVKSGTSQAKKEVSDFEKSFSAASKGIIKATGVITGEVAILKKAFDFGREGAVVVQTAESFDTLMDSINGPVDLMEQLQAASRGTISELKLQSATTTLLAGTSEELGSALANSAVDILEVAKAASKLNPDLGSTEFLYQSLMTGIKRGSPMVIDNTGITLKLGEAYESLAAKLGKNADELTSDEQKMAILNATLEGGQKIIEQVGGTTEAATDNFDRLTAAIEDQANKVKTKFLPPLQDAAGTLYTLLNWGDDLSDVLNTHEKDVRKDAKSWDEYADEMLRAAEATGKLSGRENEIRQIVEESRSLNVLTNILKEYGIEVDYINEVTFYGTQINGDYVDMQEKLRGEVDKSSESVGSFAAAVPKLTGSMEELELFMSGELSEEMRNFYRTEGELEKEAEALKDEIGELEGKQWLTSSQKEQLEENKTKLEEIQKQIKENAEEHDRATKQILFDLLQQQLAMDGLTTEEGNTLAVVAEQWGLVDEETAGAYRKIQDYVGQAQEGVISVEELAELIASLGDKDIYLTTHFQETYQPGMWQGSQNGNTTVRGFASGGSTRADEPIWVGEEGVELLVPNSNSTIIPNDQIRSLLGSQQGSENGLAEAFGAMAASGWTPIQIMVQGDGLSDDGAEAWAWRTSELVLERLGG
jgi:ABC-type transporter Mla subunit MlaD